MRLRATVSMISVLAAGMMTAGFALAAGSVSVPAEKGFAEEEAALAQFHDNAEHEKLSLLLRESLQKYASVKNYRAIFLKQERSEGKLGEAEKIFLKFEKPWKIYMGWLNTEKKDLQVVYERGKRKGQLAIHKPGLGLGLVPVIFLDQNSPWVKKGSESYNIEDAGIGTFLVDFSRAVIRAAKEGRLKVLLKKPDQASPAGDSVEVTFDGSQEGSGYFAYRIAVLFDEKNRLPVRMELYDWTNELMGVYAYEDLKLNLPAEDEEFKRQINRFLYRVYRG